MVVAAELLILVNVKADIEFHFEIQEDQNVQSSSFILKLQCLERLKLELYWRKAS
jgi:hypothetical protein